MRNRSAIVFLMLSVVCGLLTMFFFKNWVATTSTTIEEDTEIVTSPVVVAKENLPAGSTIDIAMLETMEWPIAYLPEGTFSEADPLDQRVPRRAIMAGEPVLSAALLPPGTLAGLPALIESDSRAMSVEVDAVVGVAGFVKPGTHVDVLATMRLQGENRRAVNYARTILQNVKVLAIDQTLEDLTDAQAELVNVVTLQVSPSEAQLLSFASANGKLKLALRNPGDDGRASIPGTKDADLMDQVTIVEDEIEAAGEDIPVGPMVELIRGAKLERDYL